MGILCNGRGSSLESVLAPENGNERRGKSIKRALIIVRVDSLYQLLLKEAGSLSVELAAVTREGAGSAHARCVGHGLMFCHVLRPTGKGDRCIFGL